MTKREAVREYLRMYRKLMELHSTASNHISRRDNNWVFEAAYSMRYIAGRILCDYDVIGDFKGGGASRNRYSGDNKRTRTSALKLRAMSRRAMGESRDVWGPLLQKAGEIHMELYEESGKTSEMDRIEAEGCFKDAKNDKW